MIRRSFGSLVGLVLGAIGLGAGFRPTRPVAPPAFDPALARRSRKSRRGGRGLVETEHRAAIAALRQRPVGVGNRVAPAVRNALKRYRQGRGTWADVARAEDRIDVARELARAALRGTPRPLQVAP